MIGTMINMLAYYMGGKFLLMASGPLFLFEETYIMIGGCAPARYFDRDWFSLISLTGTVTDASLTTWLHYL